MSRVWKTVRIFISSTFRDMHSERDHLVRFVFPELKERARKKHLHVIDVDLRWGVTEEDAQAGKALDICLDEIDTCRPYFIGLLGHRYGYIPPGHQHSITAQEIYHGVLHGNIPMQVVDLRRILEEKLEGRSLSSEQKNCLVRCFSWDAEKNKYLLTDDVASDELEIIRSAFEKYSIYQRDRSFFFFRTESLSRKLTGTSESDFFEQEQENQQKLAALKKEITNGGLPCLDYDDMEIFGQQVLEVLSKRMEAESETPVEEKDWLQQERELHELFMADRTRRFAGRRDLLDRMHAFCGKDEDPRLLLITGEPGCGKSALMARFVEEVMHAHPDWLILPHFVGASPTSTNLRQTLRRLCIHLNGAIGSTEEVPEDIKELLKTFPELLAKASQQRKILILIDAVNQLETADHAHLMHWLPQVLPQNVRFVISTLAGETRDAMLRRRIKPQEEAVTGLTPDEIREFVETYLHEIRHEFPNTQVEQAFYRKVEQGNPLYILVALEELRIFGKFEALGQRIGDLPDNIPALFDQVLARIESDFNPVLVRDCMSYIACGKHGMTAEELQTLLKAHAPRIDPNAEAPKLPDMLWSRLYRSLSAYLFERSSVIDFFHGQLKEAVGKRYLQKEIDRDLIHKSIADYFETRWRESYVRALDELPHQRNKAKDRPGLERVLCDLKFIEAKCAATLTFDLVRDYREAVDCFPEVQPVHIVDRSENLRAYRRSIALYSVDPNKNPLPPVPQSIPLKTTASKMTNTQNALRFSPAERINAFSQFLRGQSHNLAKYSHHAGFCLQQAYNWTRSGPVADAANKALDKLQTALLRFESCRPSFEPGSVSALQGHIGSVTCLTVSSDGRRLISGSKDNTVRVWDLENNQCVAVLEGHEDSVSQVGLSLDEQQVISCARYGSIRIWDAQTGVCIHSIGSRSDPISKMQLTPDGLLVSAGTDGELRVWDLRTFHCIKKLGERFTEDFRFLSATHRKVVFVTTLPVEQSPGDGRIVSASNDRTVFVWNLEGDSLHKLEGHSDSVTCLRITLDGKRAISGSYDGTLRVWDLEELRCHAVLNVHAEDIDLSCDGRIAVSGSRDNSLQVWDVETGHCLKVLTGHTGSVISVVIAPDGQIAVSGSKRDRTVRVWDLQTGKCLHVYEAGRVTCLALSADGRLVASGTDASSDFFPKEDCPVRIWNLESPALSFTMSNLAEEQNRHFADITCFALESRSNRLLSACRDKTFRVWDLNTGKCIKKFQGDLVKFAAVLPNRRLIFATVAEGLILDLESERILQRLPDPFGAVTALAASVDGQRIILGNTDGSITFWQQGVDSPVRITRAHSAAVNGLALGADGGKLVSAGHDRVVCVFDTHLGLLLHRFTGHRDSVSCVKMTTDGRIAVSSSWDGDLRVWDLERSTCVNILKGHSNWVDCIDLLPDGYRVISAGRDQSVRIWDLKTGRCTRILEGHSDWVEWVTISANGRYIISKGKDRTIRIWDVENGHCLAICAEAFSIGPVVATGSTLVVGDILGNVIFYKIKGIDFSLPPLSQKQPQRTERSITELSKVRTRIGQNAPCPCGSGKKYKKCHGQTPS